ncbi:MAG: hypothetical protein SGPRY_008235, partial [Prymnesium sp.]
VVVRPGDAIIGDQDGVVCVPAAVAQQVYDNAHGREEIEVIIKEELIKSALSLCSHLSLWTSTHLLLRLSFRLS